MKQFSAVLRKVLESNLVCLGQLRKTAKGGQARSVDEKQNSQWVEELKAVRVYGIDPNRH